MNYTDAVRVPIAVATAMGLLAFVFAIVSFLPGLGQMSIATTIAAAAMVISGITGARRAERERRA